MIQPKDEQTHVSVAFGLTEAEYELFAKEFRTLAPGVDFTSHPIDWNHGPRRLNIYSHRAQLSDVIPKINAVMEIVRPIAETVASLEKVMVQYVDKMLNMGMYDWDRESESPLYQLCLNWEFSFLDAMLRRFQLERTIDQWCDGFMPQAVHRAGNGLQLSGYCYLGRESDASEWKGPFEARIALNEDRDRLRNFELRAGDAAAMTREHVIDPNAPDILVDHVASYDVKIRKSVHEAERVWAFEFNKLSANREVGHR
ncbi:MAG: hypothetical protein ACJ8C4_16910 [Gemmataceae bacterium]